ncbi:ABC transporter ATP-binding protein [Kutzneria albida]|uniref:Multidrug ABC transporter ATPase/permease n=1 Tax=Kutzneria albida DSM 43870 TaxID=1449976 RepID=W5W7Z7_9PSEU|nr:ABC transporter ATP-binding protein [Kutzneria albida]AHH97062.1 multidrug ABC transporter ATPase/permease [Kutzneria albida DSM 43870]
MISTVPDSGLTGSVDIPEPEEPKQDNDLRSRWARLRQSVSAVLRGLPRVVRLSWEAGPWLTTWLALATVISGLSPAATAYMAKLLLDSVTHAVLVHTQHLPDQAVLGPFTLDTVQMIIAVAVLQLLLTAVTTVMNTVSQVSQGLLQDRVSHTIQLKVMDHASKLDLAFFEDSASYDLLRQAQQEAPSRPMSMMNGAFGLIRTLITFSSMIALLLTISPLLAAVAVLAPIPAFIAESRYGLRTYRFALWTSPIRRRMDYLGRLVTTDEDAKEVKLFGLGPYFVDRFRQLGKVYFARQRKLSTERTLRSTGWGMLTTLTGSLTYLYIALEAVYGRLTLGDLLLFTQATSSVQGSVSALFSGATGMYENNLYLDNLYKLLATEPTITRPERPRELPKPVRGHVVFEHVSFSYQGSERPALSDVSFEIRPGETAAVVGRNGAGKSTLFKLLCRLYDPTGGRILLDGVDLRELDPDDLRLHISAMFQDYVTYQATAAENIGLGDLGRVEDRPRVESAAAAGGADELLTGLSRGYDTPLGRWFNEGANLSGGEWQKVVLSRAFMRDAPLLVLDEPTSALDAQAEYDLFARLRRLSHGRTTLYISHRFSTVRQADRILFLQGGELVESGTHAELMRVDGQYAHLFTLQAAAYLDAPAAKEA